MCTAAALWARRAPTTRRAAGHAGAFFCGVLRAGVHHSPLAHTPITTPPHGIIRTVSQMQCTTPFIGRPAQGPGFRRGLQPPRRQARRRARAALPRRHRHLLWCGAPSSCALPPWRCQPPLLLRAAAGGRAGAPRAQQLPRARRCQPSTPPSPRVPAARQRTLAARRWTPCWTQPTSTAASSRAAWCRRRVRAAACTLQPPRNRRAREPPARAAAEQRSSPGRAAHARRNTARRAPPQYDLPAEQRYGVKNMFHIVGKQ